MAVSGRDTLAPFSSAAGKHVPAALRAHAGPEPDLFFTASFVRLKSSFGHGLLSLSEICGANYTL